MDDSTAMDESTRPGERYCRRCGYNLHGLDKHRCPECGQGFDPANPRTFRSSPPRAWHKWARRAGVLALAVVLLLAGRYGWLYWGWKQEQETLAKLPGFRVIGTEPLGPPWLAERLGSAGFALERVTELYGRGTPVTDLTPLAKLTGLQRLFLSGTPVTDDLTPLAKLTGLQWLNLSGASVTDLTPLAKLTGLQWLFLGGTPVTDLTPLAKLTGLQELDLSYTSVTDLTPLAKLTGLQWLWLDSTPVTDLTPLAGLTGLRSLSLPAGIQAEDVAELRRALPQCWITQPDAPIPATQPATAP